MTYKVNSHVSGEHKSCRRETYSAVSRREKVKRDSSSLIEGGIKTYLLQLESDLALKGCAPTVQTDWGLQPTA